ncbi:MAG TPA: glycosyltransferase [Pyrinomonadaceae bacterium]|nr:glycosyltransferase [Pyrinomonadaceae bacterium]
MKVVRIIARLNVGGPARHVVWLSAGLPRDEFQSLLVAGVVPPGEDDMGYFATEQGIEPHIIPEMSREISPKDVVTIWKLYRLFVRERPDIVHTHTAKAGTVGRIAGLLYRWLTLSALWGRPRRRCRFVHTYHGHIFHSYYGRLKTRIFLVIEKFLARTATDKIIVISPQQRREIHQEFGVGESGQFALIPLGMDVDVYADWAGRRNHMRDELGAGQDEILIGIVGRLTEVKNHDLFLRAAALYKQFFGTKEKGGTRVRFVIVGNGHLREQLERSARELGIYDDVEFLGTRNDAQNFYPALDIVALTSLNEGTPLTLIEAMANERACVATSVGGVIDLLGGKLSEESTQDLYELCERGVRVPSGDAEAFCHGLRRLVGDPALRRELGARGARFVAESYSKKRLLADITKLYRELAGLESGVWSLESELSSPESQVESGAVRSPKSAFRNHTDSRLQTPDSRL